MVVQQGDEGVRGAWAAECAGHAGLIDSPGRRNGQGYARHTVASLPVATGLKPIVA